MDFALNEEQLEFKAQLPRLRPRRDPPRRAQARRRGEHSVGGHQGGPQAGPAGRSSACSARPATREGQMQVISAEESHWGCAGTALAISGSGLAAAGIAASGTPEQIVRWVPECFGTGEEIKLGAYAVTEPQAGSDVKSLKTTAKRDGDEWVLNGTKVFITNGGIADVHVVVATVDPELGTRGQASFVVGKDTPGLSQGKKETKLGIRASHTAEVVLEDCRIPAENLLGGEEKLAEEARARPLGAEIARGRRARDLRGDPADRRRLGAGDRPGRLRVDPRVPRRPRRGRRAAAADAADPADAGRRRDRDRSGAAAGPARRLDGPQRRADERRPGLDVEAEGRRRGDVGDDDADGPGRPRRLEHRVPAGEVLPRREDLPAVRGHGRDPADGHLADAGARIRRAPRIRRRSRRRGGEERRAQASRSPPEPGPTGRNRWRRVAPTTTITPATATATARTRWKRGAPTAAGGCGRAGDQRRPASRPRSSAASSPARWRCSPTPATCSPTSPRSSWR